MGCTQHPVTEFRGGPILNEVSPVAGETESEERKRNENEEASAGVLGE